MDKQKLRLGLITALWFLMVSIMAYIFLFTSLNYELTQCTGYFEQCKTAYYECKDTKKGIVPNFNYGVWENEYNKSGKIEPNNK